MEVYSQESEASTLALSEQELKPVGKSRLKITLGVCSNGISRERSDSVTLENVEQETLALLTSSAADSPAKTSPTPASEQASTESAAASGPNMRESFASYDRASSSWRTSQLCLDGEWSEFSETWPRAGMTQSGKAFELPMLAPHTEESESGLWPTPEARGDSRSEGGAASRSGHQVMLHHAVKMWPTPTVADTFGTTASHPKKEHKFETLHSVTLAQVVHHREMWPTPKSSAANYGRPRENDRGDLQAAVTSFPTPTANRWDGLQSHGVNVVSGSLNPTWVEWLMGYPLGWTDLEDSATPSCPKSQSGLEGESCKA
jgi:hypothetical protein